MTNKASAALMSVCGFLLLTGASFAQNAAPPIQPHDGEWEGITSQGKAFDFAVRGSTARVGFTVIFPFGCLEPGSENATRSFGNANVPILNGAAEWTIAEPDLSLGFTMTRRTKGKSRVVPLAATLHMKAVFSSAQVMSGELTFTLADRDPKPDKDVPPCRIEAGVTFRAEYRDETGDFSKLNGVDVRSIEIGTAKWDSASCGTIQFTRLGGNLDVLTYPSSTDQIDVHVEYGYESPTLVLRFTGPVEGELVRSECPTQDIRLGRLQVGQTLIRLRRKDGSVFPPGQYSLEVAKSDDKPIFRKTLFVK
jgi:hypothetical protein